MQIKSATGAMVEVPQAQLQKVFESMHKHADKAVARLAAMDQNQKAQMIVDMYQKACQYKGKAAKNIKRLADLEEEPETQDDMKQALACIMIHQEPWMVAQATYQIMEFQSARFFQHLLKNYVKE